MGFTPSNYIGLNVAGKVKIRELMDADFNKEARQVLEDAQRRVPVIEREAYTQGFQKGEQAGKKLGIQQLAPYLDQFQALVDDLADCRRELLIRMEPEIVDLALSIAEKVVRKVTEQDRVCAKRVALAAIDDLEDRQSLTIYVNPQDFDLMTELIPEFLTIRSVEKCKVEPDENVGPGGCIIETESGTVDARIDTALRAVGALAEKNDL